MTELLNGHHTDFSGTNGRFENGTAEECSDENLKVAKPPRKKVSFHEAVTDIDVFIENDSIQNGEPLEEEKDGKEEGVDELDSLGDILNISDKINFFKNAFADTKACNNAGHGQQTSIPEARLAFVTGMVESLSAGSVSRAGPGREEPYGQEGIVNVARQDGDDDNVEKVLEQAVSDKPEDLPEIVEAADAMTAMTDVTYSKIFAPMKHKSSSVEAVVDTTSILEHREELRDLWEKRMMADDNQSSPSSTVTEQKSSKPLSEEENEEKISETKSESETKVEQKISNGFAKPIENNNCENDGNANHIQEKPVENGISTVSSSIPNSDADQDNNNSADSLEEDNAEEYNEEKTYTSKLEQTLVVKEVKETSESVADSTTVEVKSTKETEVASEAPVASETADVPAEETVPEKVDVVDQPDSTENAAEVSEVSSSAEVHEKNEVVSESVQEIITQEVITTSSSVTVKSHEQELVEAFAQAQVKGIEVPDPVDDDGDGFVRLAECIPQVDSSEDISQSEDRDMADEPEISSTSIEDHNSRPSSTESSGPTSDIKTPTSNPEIEQFVKSGGVKRIIPGVQKTEQPYSSCTTETKIAMEIREMREREEELRVMREQALLSPVVSPVPPKSPVARSPSPAQKEVHSPTPSGPGYRVSSVFGQRGTTSPSPPVSVSEEKTFKLGKESAVEKEIRMARDREEELRKQKGLPPREDDSYVKPSQVKSSQVRVFGKMVGTNNTSLKQAATAKIQLEIEEQTRREMALRETGHIQTISEERTDAKVAKLKPQENGTAHTNGNSHHHTNGNYTNGRSSPDVGPYKRTTPSPTGARPASIFSQNNNAIPKGNISMHKFIASKGKETAFSAARNGGTFIPKEDTTNRAAVPPPMVKLKRNPSVESKIQQEIMEMKQREEELKKLHMRSNENSSIDGNNMEHEMNQKNNLVEYENGNGLNDEELSPRHNKLIAQWEQRIQKAES
ncbi:uncharacterized protein LOC129216642 [Uloborus diversus]|uniref:uncharacterized protein LOC129216642 n=1 Tax=Uloborus diversus TaxID=327109 RepID=UPI00240912CC|nr:uncharacterized protein LOC129216642 [Uloborus diversus]